MNAISRPARAPALSQTSRLLDVISRSSDTNWLVTCREHNKTIRNEAVADAAQARLSALSGASAVTPAAATVRMTAAAQAHAIWVVLAARAAGTSTTEAKITYGDLAVAIGYPHKGAARTIKAGLTLLGEYCIRHDLPALNALAVNQASMEAGDAVVLNDGATPRSERARILAFDWAALPVPEAAAFATPKVKK